MEGIDVIRETHPEMYVIFWLLIVGIGGLLFGYKILWYRLKELDVEKSKIQADHIKTALSATETIKDALFLIQETNKNVEMLGKDTADRKIFESGVHSKLESMEKTISNFILEIRKLIKK